MAGQIFKAGITCDFYKTMKFKEVLEAKGFTDYTVTILNFALQINLIVVQTTEDKKAEIQKVCEEVELYFKAKKN